MKIGVTAPSFGLHREFHQLLEQAINQMKQKGYEMTVGETCWTQYKAKSSPSTIRAQELNAMLQDESIQLIIPPMGGELLIEIIEQIDFENVQPKWLMGYSDISMLLLAITLKTGIATAHGSNLMELVGENVHPITAMWENVLQTKKGEEIIQYSSNQYEKEWDQIHLDTYYIKEEKKWKTVFNNPMIVEGRLLGGCIDAIRYLIGTPYGNVQEFRRKYIYEEPIIWYFENWRMNVTELRRSLVQMKLAGWFDHCNAIIFGRSSANETVDDYHILDVYMELAEELNISIAYDIDCGHVLPQMTLINGAYAKIKILFGEVMVSQKFI